jgi:hypothetical protein
LTYLVDLDAGLATFAITCLELDGDFGKGEANGFTNMK